MSTFTNWTTSELLVLMEAIQYCQKTNQMGWRYVSDIIKRTMSETGMTMSEKYNEYGCSSQYNDFEIRFKMFAGDRNFVEFAVETLRDKRVKELEKEISEREQHIKELRSYLN
ncbi:Myb-like domain-containing protein [Entamoeba marina]